MEDSFSITEGDIPSELRTFTQNSENVADVNKKTMRKRAKKYFRIYGICQSDLSVWTSKDQK